MDGMILFQRPEFGRVRCYIIEGEPWFVAKDICDCLDISNTTDAVSRLDDDERSRLDLGRQGAANIVNEYGVYNLVLGSRKPEARQFKRWITHDVLPSIRRHGMYACGEMPEDELMAKALVAANETIERVRAERDEAVKRRAQISSSREAAAMGRLGAEIRKNKELSKENGCLRDALGGHADFYTASSIPWVLKYMTHAGDGSIKCDVYNRIGTALCRLCAERGIRLPGKVVNRDGNFVNVYPASAVDELERIILSRDTGNQHYRFMLGFIRPEYRP